MSWRKSLFLLICLGTICTVYMYSVAVRDPVIRTATISMPDWPEDAPPLKIMHVSDVHVAGPDMPPERLARIVEQINASDPDLVVFAGDFVSDKRVATRYYHSRDAFAPLSGLNAPLGTVAVLGNHDHWRGLAQISVYLTGAGIEILKNGATRKGPIILGGVDDDHTGRAKTIETLAAMDRLQQLSEQAGRSSARIMLSHSPDIMPEIPRAGKAGFVPLVLAGHTHCGQISFPIIGALTYVSRYGDRYACGVIREDGKTLVVGAGLGTSILPLRLGAVPDMWLLTLGS